MNPQSGPSIGVENDASPSRVKDEDLVVQARAHDPLAIEELVHRYQQKAYVVAFHLSDENEQDAEDLTQEAFQLKALHGMSIQEIARITFGWFGMDLIQSPDTDQDSMGPSVENQAVVRDLELIKDIDFLEDLDTLQELVTVLDRNESI